MIVELRVENLAIIDRCELQFGPGLTVLTGETGAGKSLLVDALDLVFGGRADSHMVRSGAARAVVEATISLAGRPELAEFCRQREIEVVQGRISLQREVLAEGRSQCRICGRQVPLAMLREVGAVLADLHGQHDHQSLLDVGSHLGFLDAWIGMESHNLQNDVREAVQRWQELERKLATLSRSRRDREQRVDMLQFQIEEIAAVSPKADEMAELEAMIRRLKHSAALSEAVEAVRQALIEGEPAGSDLLTGSLRTLSEAEKLDPAITQVSQPLGQAAIHLEEAIGQLREYEASIEASPDQLEATAERIDDLRRLRRKYGETEAAVLTYWRSAEEELELLRADDEGEDRLAQWVEDSRNEAAAACEKLTQLRTAKAVAFAEEIQGQIRDLAMEKARFEVAIEPKPPEPDGADDVEFLFSANVGEPLRPLSRIASGGEISRVMLAIKTALSGRAGVPTLLFDEVDTGLGGRAAATVAGKLETIAQHDQVLVITHLPQIAGRATAHFRIEKGEVDGRVKVTARQLAEAERVEEIARMIAGEQVGPSAHEHAKALLGHSLKP